MSVVHQACTFEGGILCKSPSGRPFADKDAAWAFSLRWEVSQILVTPRQAEFTFDGDACDVTAVFQEPLSGRGRFLNDNAALAVGRPVMRFDYKPLHLKAAVGVDGVHHGTGTRQAVGSPEVFVEPYFHSSTEARATASETPKMAFAPSRAFVLRAVEFGHQPVAMWPNAPSRRTVTLMIGQPRGSEILRAARRCFGPIGASVPSQSL